jgi:mono/diheme cytochrome c family protein
MRHIHDLVSALAVVAIVCSGAAVRSAQAQEPAAGRPADGTTVWDGVYTAAQADRGRAQYETSCTACHRGGPRKDDAFMHDWSGSDVKTLFNQIRASMPAGAPSSLSDAAYLDIVAYILQVNAFPAGPRELVADALNRIRIESRSGPEAVPNFALIRAVGCLTQRGDAVWILADASEPARTKDPSPSTDDERRISETTALGAHTFELMNVYPKPDPSKGVKVEAKGFLIRDPGGNRINTTSVQSLAARCDGAR